MFLNEGVNVMVVFVVLLLNFKFFCLLRFNWKIFVLFMIIKISVSKFVSFMIMFMVIFLVYCFLVYFVFGFVFEEYCFFIRCMVFLMFMVLGNFEFYDLVVVNVVIGLVVFFIFMVVF